MTHSAYLAWFTGVVTLVGSFIVLSIRTSPQLAIGIVGGFVMMLPAWLVIPLFSTQGDTIYGSGLDAKLAVLMSCLLLYCFMPGRTFPLKLVPSDYAMLALVIVHFISDVLNSEFSWMIPARIYAEWFAPYVAGRLALQKLEISESHWKAIAIACVMIGLLAVIESMARLKVFEVIAGMRPEEGFSRDVERWGVLRAYGTTMHPIYFGGLQLLILAWPTFGAAQAIRGRVSPIWIFAPIVSIAGIAATASRAPILALSFYVLFLIFALVRQSRIPMVATAALAIVLAIWNFSWIIEKFEDWSGESRTSQFDRVKVDGEKVAMSGTRSRMLLLDVYRIAITRSGFFGYGTVATTGFPIDVPVNGQDPETLKKIKYIDNAYLLILLRFGYAGALCFVLACLASLWQFYWIARVRPPRSIQYLCATLGASLAACYFLIATVWLPSDMSYPMLWTMGISSGVFHAVLRDGFPQSRQNNARS